MTEHSTRTFVFPAEPGRRLQLIRKRAGLTQQELTYGNPGTVQCVRCTGLRYSGAVEKPHIVTLAVPCPAGGRSRLNEVKGLRK